MAIFDLKVRLIPDSGELKRELKQRQRVGARGSAQSLVTGSAVGGAVGAEAASMGKEFKIAGFGKLLGFAGIIATVIEALDFIIKPIMNLLKALLMILFLPLIPILKPLMIGLAKFIGFLTPIMQKISGWIEKFVGILGDGITWVWENLLKPIWEGLKSSFIVIWEGLKWVWDSLLKPVFEGLWAGLKFVFGLVIDGIKWYWDLWGGAFKLIWSGLKWAWDSLLKPTWEWIKDKFRSIWTKIIEPVWNFIKDKFNTLKEVLGNIIGAIKNALSKIPFIGSKFESSNAGDFILRPNGGLIKTDPRDTIVGFRADKGSSAMSGGQTINLNINNPSIRSETDIRKLANEISRILATQGRRQFS